MDSRIKRSPTFHNGKEENGDKWVRPIQRPPPMRPHFAPLRVPIGNLLVIRLYSH
jgi:hypothetical protein